MDCEPLVDEGRWRREGLKFASINNGLLVSVQEIGTTAIVQSAAFVSKLSWVVAGPVPVTTTLPSPLLSGLLNSKQRFCNALSFEVSKVRSTVPRYPPAGVTVIVELPVLPWLTVTFEALSAIVPFPETTTGTFTVTLPVEEAWAASPAQVTTT